MKSDFNSRIDEWSKPPFDKSTQLAILKLRDNPEHLEDAFYKDLDFGTGGMRGIMGVGTNRINQYTLGKSTQGLSDYLKKKFTGEIKTVIAYDCRKNSKSLARKVAEVFSANDILPDTLLIDVPHNLLIPVKEIKSLTNFKNAFEEIFFKTINIQTLINVAFKNKYCLF